MTSSNMKRLVFFDFVTHFGGAQQSTVSLGQRLQTHHQLNVLDAYGACGEYLTAWNKIDVATSILQPQAQEVYVGHSHQPFKRAWGLLRQGGHLFKLAQQLKTQLNQLSPDFIWTNSLKGLAVLYSAGAMSRYPVAWYARGWCRSQQVPFWGKYLVKRLPAILAVSQATSQALQQWGVPADKIHVIHSIIDWEGLHQQIEQGADTSPPSSDAACKLILPAQLLYSKGQHTAIAAVDQLVTQGLDVVLWLCGGIKQGGNQRYREALKQMIEQAKLENHVFLLGPRSDVPALIQRADIVLLPSHTEGWPRVVWEGQALERPVIATEVGGVTDLIEHEKTGLLIPVENATALAQAIEVLHQNPSLSHDMTQRAKAKLETNFSPETQLRAFEDVVETLCA